MILTGQTIDGNISVSLTIREGAEVPKEIRERLDKGLPIYISHSLLDEIIELHREDVPSDSVSQSNGGTS